MEGDQLCVTERSRERDCLHGTCCGDNACHCDRYALYLYFLSICCSSYQLLDTRIRVIARNEPNAIAKVVLQSILPLYNQRTNHHFFLFSTNTATTVSSFQYLVLLLLLLLLLCESYSLRDTYLSIVSYGSIYPTDYF